VNVKRVHRLWKREGLKVPKKQRKKRPIGGVKRSRHRATHKDHVWAWDFIFDRTTQGRSLKWLSLVDEYTRECLALEVGHHFRADDVLRDWFVIRGVPQHIRSDNGPEFIAHAIQTWLTNVQVETLYIPPGAPWENGSAESFHSRFRDEFLDAEEFDNLAHARVLSTSWRRDYNHHRPPAQCLRRSDSRRVRRDVCESGLRSGESASTAASPALRPDSHTSPFQTTEPQTPQTLITPGTKSGALQGIEDIVALLPEVNEIQHATEKTGFLIRLTHYPKPCLPNASSRLRP
jgi:transposase InsO family protein